MARKKQFISVVNSDFENGTAQAEVRKVFELKNEQWAIVKFPYSYLNSGRVNHIDKVVHYGTGMSLPFQTHSKTLKGKIEETEEGLNDLVKRGAVIKDEISKHKILNK